MDSSVRSLPTIQLEHGHRLTVIINREQRNRPHRPEELVVSMRISTKRSFNLFLAPEERPLPEDDDTFETTFRALEHKFARRHYEDHLQQMADVFAAFPMIAAGRTAAYRSYKEVVESEIQDALQRGANKLNLLVGLEYSVDVPTLTPEIREGYRDELRRSEVMIAESLEKWNTLVAQFVSSEDLERFVWNSVDAADEECSICMEEFVANESEVTRIACKHVFHDICINRWLQLHNSCPLCRFVLNTEPN